MEHHITLKAYTAPRSRGLRKLLHNLYEFLSTLPEPPSGQTLSEKIGPHLARDIGLEPPETRVSVPRHPML